MEGSFEHCEQSSQFSTMDIQQDTNSVSSSSNSSNFTFQFDLSYIFSEEETILETAILETAEAKASLKNQEIEANVIDLCCVQSIISIEDSDNSM